MRRNTYSIPGEKTSCEIVIKPGLMDVLAQEVSSLGTQFVVVMDSTVQKLYEKTVLETLAQINPYIVSFSSGEAQKTRKTKELLEDTLFSKGFGRDTCIIAFGGGVVTDLTGYLAATYCRGVPLVMVPTSLLAMVDASIGGKNGVNLSYGKNLIGTVYQPEKILIDPLLLATLPVREYKNGIVEIIKIAAVCDLSLWTFLEENVEKVDAIEPVAIEEVIFRSSGLKQSIVIEDEKEKKKRMLLNFGHTVGHALELLSEYTIPHGEAVAIGMLVESYIATSLGVFPEKDRLRLEKLLKAYAIGCSLPKRFSVQDLLEVIALDKKAQNKKPRFVLLEKIGTAIEECCVPVSERYIINALEWMNCACCIN